MKRKILILTIIFSLLFWRQNNLNAQVKPVPIEKRLLGKWKKLGEIDDTVAGLEFYKNHSVKVLTIADTILYYGYRVNNGTLIFRDGVKNMNNPILRLTKDTLIFKSFYTDKTKQVYIRTIDH